MPEQENARTNHEQNMDEKQAARNEAWIIVIMGGFGVAVMLLGVATFMMGSWVGSTMPGAGGYFVALGLGLLVVAAMKYHLATGGGSNGK